MDPKRQLLLHLLATLAYRFRKAVQGASPEFGTFTAGAGVRTPSELVSHMTSVLGYARTQFTGGTYVPNPVASFEEETQRFHEMLDGLAGHVRYEGTTTEGLEERLLQGPLADAMTHCGQLAMLRRLAGDPIARENFFVADIDAGRLAQGKRGRRS